MHHCHEWLGGTSKFKHSLTEDQPLQCTDWRDGPRESETCPVSSMAMPRLENPGVSRLLACPQFYHLVRLFLHLTQLIHPSLKGLKAIFPYFIYVIFKIYFFIDFREEGRGRERDRNIDDEREPLIGCLPHDPHWGWSPQPGACALEQNRTWDPSVRRLMLYPLNQTG
uniref:Uncharacterized protein n=1 Tax=Myotis myotis TaxID=51298 RepID=A0A7J7ZYE8_MYOMY|nr:hypothetical protein mMyoMyo1_009662 [Myotis myotis]